MKNLQFISVCFLAIASQASYAEEVDFGRLNPVLQTLADAVVAGDDLVEFASPQFDEALSDLELDRLKYDLKGTLGGTSGVPWLNGGKADLQIATSYAADRNPSHLGISVGIDTQIKTEIMPLIRYTARMALRKKTTTWPERFEPKIDTHLRQLSVARSLEDVLLLLQSGQRLAADFIKARIESQEERLAKLEEGQYGSPQDVQGVILDTKKSIESWNRVLKTYQSTSIQSEKAEDKITQLVVSNSDAKSFTEPGSGNYHAEKALLQITNKDLRINIKAFFPTQQKKLDRLKSKLKARLLRTQTHETDSKDYVQEKFRDALISFKETIRGQI
jgi:hypothetical protein